MLAGPHLSGLLTRFNCTGTAAVSWSVTDIPRAKQPAEHAAIAADARMEERADIDDRTACDGQAWSSRHASAVMNHLANGGSVTEPT